VKFTAHISLLEYLYRKVCKWMETCQRGERGAEVVCLGHKSPVMCQLKGQISVSGKNQRISIIAVVSEISTKSNYCA